MQFRDIVGQEKLIQDLSHITQAGHLPHAILLLGKKGWGGLPLGIALAQYLMCDQAEQDSCGTCHNCLMIHKLSHPDVALTFPAIKHAKYSNNLSEYFLEEFREFVAQTPYADVKKWFQLINAENNQGNITAEQCRIIADYFNLKSYQGKKKIQIIWLPEYLGKEGNILLKLIEEPPQDSYLIFISEKEHEILGTIRSRLQKFELKPIAQATIEKALIETHGKDPETALSISKLADGDYEKAQELAQDITDDIMPIIQQFIYNIYDNKGVEITRWVDDVSKMGRETIKGLLQYIQDIFSTAIHIKYGAKQMDQLHMDEKHIVQKILSVDTHIDKIESIKEGVQDAQYAISRNAHIKSQLLNLHIDMQYWIKNKELTVI